MSWVDDYIIPFYGLKEGIHEYDFEARDEFFEFFDNPDVCGGNLQVSLELYRKPQFLELKFRIEGNLRVICDRCLEEFYYPVSSRNELYVKFGDDFEEISDTVITIPFEETRINIAQYIYEFSILALPMQKIHSDKENGESGCNMEMVRKLNSHSKGEYSTGDETDPRWDVLRNLKSRN